MPRTGRQELKHQKETVIGNLNTAKVHAGKMLMYMQAVKDEMDARGEEWRQDYQEQGDAYALLIEMIDAVLEYAAVVPM